MTVRTHQILHIKRFRRCASLMRKTTHLVLYGDLPVRYVEISRWYMKQNIEYWRYHGDIMEIC